MYGKTLGVVTSPRLNLGLNPIVVNGSHPHTENTKPDDENIYKRLTKKQMQFNGSGCIENEFL